IIFENIIFIKNNNSKIFDNEINKNKVSKNNAKISQANKENADGSTSSLKRHLEKQHKNIITNEKITGAMDKFVKKEELLFTQEDWNNDLIKWIISDDQSFVV
ncbi:10513_t:CDS:2, partial [Gigaspora margarita]